MPTKTLTEGSPAVKKLREMFREKKVELNSKPKEVWESNPLFQEYKLDNFRSKLNKLKEEYFGKFTNLFYFIFKIVKRSSFLY